MASTGGGEIFGNELEEGRVVDLAPSSGNIILPVELMELWGVTGDWKLPVLERRDRDADEIARGARGRDLVPIHRGAQVENEQGEDEPNRGDAVA